MFGWRIMTNLFTLLFVYGTVVVSNAEIVTTYPYPSAEIKKSTAFYGTPAKVIKVEHKPSTELSPSEFEPFTILPEVPLRLSTKTAEEFIPRYRLNTKSEELTANTFLTKLPKPPKLLPFISRSLDYKYDLDKPHFVKSTATVPVPVPYDFAIPHVNYDIPEAPNPSPLFVNTNSIGVDPSKEYRFFLSSISHWLSPLVVKLCELIPLNHGQIGVVEVPTSPESTNVEADVIVVPESEAKPEFIPPPPELPPAVVPEVDDVFIEPIEISALYPGAQIQNVPPTPELIEGNPVVSVEVVDNEGSKPISIPSPPELAPFQPSEFTIEPIDVPVVTQAPESVENVESKKPIEVPSPPELAPFQTLEFTIEPIDLPVVTQEPELIENVESKKPVEVPSPPELAPFQTSEFTIEPIDLPVVTQDPELVENVESKKPVELPSPPELPPFRPSEISSEIYIDTAFRPHPSASVSVIPPPPELTEIPVVPPAPEIIETRHHKQIVAVPEPPELPLRRIPITPLFENKSNKPLSVVNFIPPAPVLSVKPLPKFPDSAIIKERINKVIPPPPELPLLPLPVIPAKVHIEELKKSVTPCPPIFGEFLHTNLRAAFIPQSIELAAAPVPYLPSNTIDILPGPQAKVYGPPL